MFEYPSVTYSVRFDRRSYLKDIRVWISFFYRLSEIWQTFVFEGYSCLNIHLLSLEWDLTDIRIQRIFVLEYPSFIIWVRSNRHLYSKDIHVWISICCHLSEIRQTFIFLGYSGSNIHLLSFVWDSTDIRIWKIFVFEYPSVIIWMRFDKRSHLKDIRVRISICYHLSEIRQTFLFEEYSCSNINYYNLNEIQQTFVFEGSSCLNIHLLSFEWDLTDIHIRRIFVLEYPSL
jgi:hypothetical protein